MKQLQREVTRGKKSHGTLGPEPCIFIGLFLRKKKIFLWEGLNHLNDLWVMKFTLNWNITTYEATATGGREAPTIITSWERREIQCSGISEVSFSERLVGCRKTALHGHNYVTLAPLPLRARRWPFVTQFLSRMAWVNQRVQAPNSPSRGNGSLTHHVLLLDL